MEIRDIFKSNGPIKELKDNYKPRESQIKAAEIVYNSISISNDHTIFEGPTGFGKTLAYLIPIFKFILDKRQVKVVIVTKGINLQEQLTYIDLPLVQNIFYKTHGHKVTFGLLKGKQNFICFRKMSNIIIGGARIKFESGKDEVDIGKIQTWFSKTNKGDFSELNIKPSYNMLSQITCINDKECEGRRCNTFYECYYQKHKEKALESSVVITNYHMFFTDLKIRKGSILGDYEIAVFDEAHDMQNIGRSFISKTISTKSITQLLSELREVEDKCKLPNKPEYRYISKKKDLSIISQKLIDGFNNFFSLINRYFFQDVKITNILIDDTLRLPSNENISKSLLSIRNIIYDAICFYDELIEDGILSDEYEKELSSCLKYYQDIEYKANVMYRIFKDIYDEKIIMSKHNCFYFLKNRDNSISIQFKPMNLGKYFYQNLLSEGSGVSCIFTSATLSINNNFKYIKNNLGLDLVDKERVSEYIGESPFDLKNNQRWYLPEKLINGNSKEFLDHLPEMIKELVYATNGGALILFTSIYNMKDCYNKLNTFLSDKNITPLIDGEKSRLKLMQEFKENKNSVLFATKSFFEGVDVPGEALRCLIVDKIPHPLKTDPIWTKLADEKNSFGKYFLPESIIALKQAIGRGNRDISDKCVIAVLDGRIKTARYSKIILNSFNLDIEFTSDLREIKSFINPSSIYISKEENELF